MMKTSLLGSNLGLRRATVRPQPALMFAAALGGAMIGIVFGPPLAFEPEAVMAVRSAEAAESTFAMRMHRTPRPMPIITFEDEDGRTLTLTNFHGRIVLLNLWATWCPPCRKEMPTLDRLQQRLGGKDFEVVALSIDRGGIPVVRKFFDEIGVTALAIFVDRSAAVGGVLGVMGVPTTLLIDREGRELGRLAGPAAWDSPEIVKHMKRYLAPGK